LSAEEALEIPVGEYIEESFAIDLSGSWEQLGKIEEEFVWALDKDKRTCRLGR
jgi:hypothetical protein